LGDFLHWTFLKITEEAKKFYLLFRYVLTFAKMGSVIFLAVFQQTHLVALLVHDIITEKIKIWQSRFCFNVERRHSQYFFKPIFIMDTINTYILGVCIMYGHEKNTY
jgi:hypothetical protein